MAGYRNDYSMSNNAYAAYQDNIRPYSRWGKRDILDALPAEIVEEYRLQKYPLWFLKEALLQQESWHHTGKMYNRTNFWEVVAPECSVNEFSRLYSACLLRQEKEAEKRPSADLRKVKVKYLQWGKRGGTPTEHTEYGVIYKNFVYLESGGRKRVDGNHIQIVQEYARAPRGAGSVFEEIMGRVPK